MSNHIDPDVPQEGLILSRHQYDRGQSCVFDIWVKTSIGVSLLKITGQHPVCFVRQSDVERVMALIKEVGLQSYSQPLSLLSFEKEPMSGLYSINLAEYYRLKATCEAESIELFESDIRPVERFLMERFVKGAVRFVGQGSTKPGYVEYHSTKIAAAKLENDQIKSLSFVSVDIECNEKGQLFSIGLYSEAIQKVLYNTEGMLCRPQSDTIIGQAPDYLEWVDSERSLLKRFVDVVNDVDPDCLIGWNFIGFDVRLLDRAAKRNNIRLLIGRDGSELKFSDGRRNGQSFPDRASVAGRVVLDGIDVLKNATYHFQSYALDNVAKALLSDQKIKLTDDAGNKLEEIKRLYQQQPLTLAAYNLQDCKLVADIFTQEKLLTYLVVRSELTGLELDKTGGSVAAFQNLYMPLMHRKGWIAPNLVNINDYLHSPGGFVMDSKPGIHKQVLVFDFKSLYPSIIRTFNIDPVALIEADLITKDQRIPGFRGGEFSREKSLLSDILDDLWKAREQAKAQGNKIFSNAIKIIMNSFYGVLGSAGCRFYDTKLASSITMRGHWILNETKIWFQENELDVIYGDTDSVFVSGKGKKFSKTDAKKISEKLNSHFSDKLKNEFSLHSKLELEYENTFEPFFMPTIRGTELGSKKRYAGQVTHEDGNKEIIYKGLETVRSDWTPLAKQFQQDIFELVFKNESTSEYIDNYIKQLKNSALDGLLNYRKRIRNDLVSYTKTTPPHIRAARAANQLLGYEKYKKGSLIEYYLAPSGPVSIDQDGTYDYQHYIEKQLLPIAESILIEHEPAALLHFENQLFLL